MREAITIKEIARQLRISPSTVSRALQDNPRISQKTREAVQALANQLKYFPSTTARNLRSGKTGVFAMVLPEIRENFFSEVVNGVEELAFNNQYTGRKCADQAGRSDNGRHYGKDDSTARIDSQARCSADL